MPPTDGHDDWLTKVIRMTRSGPRPFSLGCCQEGPGQAPGKLQANVERSCVARGRDRSARRMSWQDLDRDPNSAAVLAHRRAQLDAAWRVESRDRVTFLRDSCQGK